jgi:hypothetical protein
MQQLDTNNHIKHVCFFTCPATAKPSARREDVNQTCKQIWNAAIVVEPNRVALDAAKVTQIVAATTRANSRKPASQHRNEVSKMH